MKIKMLKSTNCDGKRVKAGEVVEDASGKDGRFLINLGFAEEYTPKKGRPKRAPVDRMDDVRETRELG